MTAHTQHLEDPQRDTFAACGIIVIDGEVDWYESRSKPIKWVAPEGWRILTEPCRCAALSGKAGWTLAPGFKQVKPCSDCVGGRRVVTLTATCPDGAEFTHDHYVVALDTKCSCVNGVVTLGRFTIPTLWPVIGSFDLTERGPWPCVWIDPPGEALLLPGLEYEDSTPLPLDPLPHPGQFIARPEKVPE